MVNLGAVVAAAGGKGGTLIIVAYVIIFAAMIYFMSYRPQKKEKKRMDEMMSTLAVGDSVLTSSGFYGVVIDITEDTVIVEFGNNKNCRIPMQKVAIVQIEKPE
jgi:preprotein translocase, yajC subunit